MIKLESVRQTKSVWCSKDRAKAWNDLMMSEVVPLLDATARRQ